VADQPSSEILIEEPREMLRSLSARGLGLPRGVSQDESDHQGEVEWLAKACNRLQ